MTQLMWIGFSLGGGAFGGKYLSASGYIFFICFIFLLILRGSYDSKISGLNENFYLCEYPNS